MTTKKSKRLPACWLFSIIGGAISSALITIAILFVDDIEGISSCPDWMRGVAMIVLIVTDFPALIASLFYSGFTWPESLPTFIWPDGYSEVLFAIATHSPSLVFWLGVGFIVGRSRENYKNGVSTSSSPHINILPTPNTPKEPTSQP